MIPFEITFFPLQYPSRKKPMKTYISTRIFLIIITKRNVDRTDIFCDLIVSTAPLQSIMTSSQENAELSNCINSSTISSKTSVGLVLIWYDENLTRETDTTSKMIEELRHMNDYIIFCTTEQRCRDSIRSIINEKIFLIIHGEISSNILHECEQIDQIDSIFGYHSRPKTYEHFLKQYSKLIGIYSTQDTFLVALKNNMNFFERQFQTFHFFENQPEKSIRNLSVESTSFLWFQLFKDLLERLPRNEHSKQELIDFSRQYYHENQQEFQHINEFQRNYTSHNAIQWYTRDTFLYRLLNKALRTEDICQLYTFRYFIVDLSANLNVEYHKWKARQNSSTNVMLYRGLKLMKEELLTLKENEGGIISVNGFFSTTRSKSIALDFARKPTKRPNVLAVIYEIECNTCVEGIIFADIAQYSAYPDEEEVLFDIGTTFRIQSIEIDCNLSIIHMETVNDGRRIAQDYIEFNRKQEDEMNVTIIFGKLLTLMGKYEQSLKYFHNLLNNPSSTEDHARIYNNIATNYRCQAQYDQAIENYQRAYELMINAKPIARIKDSARPLTNLGNVFREWGQFNRALSMYLQALEIVENYQGKEHLQTAIILFHIGNTYYEKKSFHQALECAQKSLQIRDKLLPTVHIRRAQSLTSIGRVYTELEQYDQALDYHRKSLDMFEKLLPTEHDDIASCLMNIAVVLHRKQELNQALDYCFSALKIQEKIFGKLSGHPQLAATRRQIGLIYEDQHNRQLAQIYYENALNMNLRLLPHEHPDILRLKNDLIRIQIVKTISMGE